MSRSWVDQINEAAAREGPYEKHKKWEPYDDMSWAEFVARCNYVFLQPGYQSNLPPDHEAQLNDVKESTLPYYAGVMMAGALQRWLVDRGYDAVDKEQRMPGALKKRVPSYQTVIGEYQITCSIMIDDDDMPYMHVDIQRNHHLHQYWYLPLNPHPEYTNSTDDDLLTHVDPGFDDPGKVYAAGEMVPPGSLPDRPSANDDWDVKWTKGTAHWMTTAMINTVIHAENTVKKLHRQRRTKRVDL